MLPFDNLSGDPEQEHLADGMTENLIATLAQIPDLFVIARNSTFTYKGMPVRVQQVAEELGVRYVLEGSVQRAGDRLRITVQLVDAVEGHHRWSERYDRELGDLFALQDELALRTTRELQVKLAGAGPSILGTHNTGDVQAWLDYIKGRKQFDRYSKAGHELAQEFYRRAPKRDPRFASAWIGMGWIHRISMGSDFNGVRPH